MSALSIDTTPWLTQPPQRQREVYRVAKHSLGNRSNKLMTILFYKMFENIFFNKKGCDRQSVSVHYFNNSKQHKMSSNNTIYFTIRRNDPNAKFFKWVIDTIDISDKQFIDDYELSCPFVCGNRTLPMTTLGVGHNSFFSGLPYNSVASDIFGCDIYGDCVFTIGDEEVPAHPTRVLHAIWKKIEPLGFPVESFLPSTKPCVIGKKTDDTALQCIACDTLIERDSREHDECMLVNKGDDLICQYCPWVCEPNCGECPVCEDTP